LTFSIKVFTVSKNSTQRTRVGEVVLDFYLQPYVGG
jgi:hypothetical protein